MGDRKACAATDCTRLAVRTGRWCATHRWRLRFHGDLNHERVVLPAEERFWSKVDRSGSCWLWTAGVRGDGYGAFRADNRRGGYGAHRFSFELANGPIPEGLVVMHICDVPLCVNPAHLRLGTNRENAADSARKARRPRGSRNSQSKLTEGQVLALRAEYASGGITQVQIADRYGVSRALVSNILSRRAWKHI